MRNVTTRPARSLSTKAPGPGLLFVFLALPLLAARAGEPTELRRARPEEVGISSERLNRVDEVIRRYIEQTIGLRVLLEEKNNHEDTKTRRRI